MAVEKIVRDGKKFVWDGKSCASEAEARAAAAAYAGDGFEVRVEKNENGFRVYSRRMATPPPAAPT